MPFDRSPKLIKDIIISFKLLLFLKKNKPDLVITCTPKIQFYFLIVSIFFRFKRIHIYTGIYWQNFSFIKKKFYQSIDLINFNFSSKVLFDSNHQLSTFEKLVEETHKLELISKGSIKGVDIDVFRPNKSFYKKFRNYFYNGKSLKIILYIGRFSKEKGIEVLIDAFRILIDTRKRDDLNLFLVGNDEYNLKDEINRLPCKYKKFIRIFDETKKPERFFQISDILCLPSKREGFGLSALEGSACGIPIISSDISGFSESVIENYNGLKFKVGDYLHLENILTKLLSDEKLSKKLGHNGLHFAKKFTSKIVIKDLYNQITKSLN